MTGILIAQIVLSILIALIFLIHPTVTAGTGWKIVAFLGLCVLPALAMAGGVNFHMQRSEQTSFCISCHSMEPYGRSLHVDDASYVPAQHFQNHRVPVDQACYACHADYTIYGPLNDKLQGLKRVYMQYVSTPPNPIQIAGGFKNANCLRCHLGARSFVQNPVHMAIMDTLLSNQLSCVSSGCHDTVHNVDHLSQVKFWSEGQ